MHGIQHGSRKNELRNPPISQAPVLGWPNDARIGVSEGSGNELQIEIPCSGR
jgi:hypothetical protein